MKKTLYTLILSFTVLTFGFSQDIHLSQFYTSEHLLNPAKVGDFEGDMRAIGNYRNQWKQIDIPVRKAITTTVLSFDKAFRYYSHEIDAGIMVAHDEFSGFGFSTDKVLLTGGYAYHWNGHHFRGGIQAGVFFRNSDLNKQTFPSQWNYLTGTFDQSFNNMESTMNSPSLINMDFNMGVQWSKQFGKLIPKVGFAINHLNRPKDSYFPQHLERLRVRKVFHGELDYLLSSKLTIQPKILAMWTTKANDVIFGSNFRYKLGHKLIPIVFAGAFYRNGVATNNDAIYPVVGCTFKEFELGLSYDVNISTLSLGNNVDRKGTFEVSLVYTVPSSKPKYITIPCDLY